jgi:hypothetical protein
MTSCCTPAADSKGDQAGEFTQNNVEGNKVEQAKFKKSIPENLQEDTSENSAGDLDMPIVIMPTYTVSFGNYKNKDDALNIISLFKKHDVEVLNITKNILLDGKVSYSLQAGHYIEKETAEKARLKYNEILSSDGRNIKTTVLKEK